MISTGTANLSYRLKEGKIWERTSNKLTRARETAATSASSMMTYKLKRKPDVRVQFRCLHSLKPYLWFQPMTLGSMAGDRRGTVRYTNVLKQENTFDEKRIYSHQFFILWNCKMLFARQFRYVCIYAYGYGVMKYAASISGHVLSTQTVKNF
jgi:hypothetical protein